MAAARFYSSVAGALDLTGSIGNSSTAITVSSTAGLPGTTPFTLVLDPGTATEEIVDVTNVSGTTLTIVRGVDGSAATSHSAGVGNVRHMATARDFREPQEHIGASASVHGVTGSVVGTDSVQTLTNKTALAATAGTKALVVKGAASQTANILDVQDSTGGTIVSVKPAEGSLTVGSGQAQINGGGAANLFGYIARFVAAAGNVVPGIFKAAASATADILQIQNSSGTVLAKFDKDGKLTTPQVTSTGDVSGTTGTFSGALSSPTITSLQSADTSLGTRIGAVETNLGSQTTFAATSAAKDGKRLHWDTFNVTTDVNGQVTINHGCGFTPSVVFAASGSSGGRALGGVDNITSTQCRLTWWWIGGGGDGNVIAPPSGNTFTASLIFGE